MGGVAQSGVATISDNGRTITVSIGSVNGNVVIKVPTVNTNIDYEVLVDAVLAGEY